MRRILFIQLLLIFCFASSSIALDQVHLRLRVIGASNEDQVIDPSLKDIHSELGSLFNFTSYRLFRDENLTLSHGKTIPIQTRKRSIEMTLVSMHANMAEIRIKVMRQEKEILNTQVRLFQGRTVLIGAGPRERRPEGAIIYALIARF